MIHFIQDRINTMFSDLVFDKKRHLYFIPRDNATELINIPSVSKLVESHAPKFNAEAILPYSAMKASRLEERPVSVHELRHRWQTINQRACDLGHKTHDFMESYTGIETPSSPQERAGVKYFHDMIQEYEIIFREVMMYSRRYKFAGTMDLPLLHRKSGYLKVADYKTNGDLFKNYKGERLLPPFDYLENTPYNKYQIQLSYYQIMLEEIGFRISQRSLVYLKADDTYREFPLIDFTEQLKQHLESKSLAA